jgi:hypothetical protein
MNKRNRVYSKLLALELIYFNIKHHKTIIDTFYWLFITLVFTHNSIPKSTELITENDL